MISCISVQLCVFPALLGSAQGAVDLTVSVLLQAKRESQVDPVTQCQIKQDRLGFWQNHDIGWIVQCRH